MLSNPLLCGCAECRECRRSCLESTRHPIGLLDRKKGLARTWHCWLVTERNKSNHWYSNLLLRIMREVRSSHSVVAGLRNHNSSEREFFEYARVSPKQVGIPGTTVTQVSLSGSQALPARFVGDIVFLGGQNPVIEVEGVFFELEKLNTEDSKCSCDKKAQNPARGAQNYQTRGNYRVADGEKQAPQC